MLELRLDLVKIVSVLLLTEVLIVSMYYTFITITKMLTRYLTFNGDIGICKDMSRYSITVALKDQSCPLH